MRERKTPESRTQGSSRGRWAPLATLLLMALGAPPVLAGPGTTVRILVQNVYGRREKDCTGRYKALAAQILAASPPFDIVALQEHWKVPLDRWFSCDAGVLTAALEADGRYAGAGRSILHQPAVDDVLQVAGGVSIFTRHRIVDSHQGKFVNGKDLPLSGYALARVRVAPGVELDLWNAHLEAGSDGCDDDCRWEQATDFGSAVELFSGLPEKGAGANPVLIVGDFNTGGPMTAGDKPPYAGNGGYANVMDALGGPRDLGLELGSGDGYTYDCALNNTAGACRYRERIDYVLLPESPKILSPASEYVLVPLKLEVTRWITPSGRHVSDHFGLDATLEIRRRPQKAACSPARALAPLQRRLEELGAADPGAIFD